MAKANRLYLNKHSFIVLGKPFERDPGFTTCSEIKESVGTISSRMGGSLYPKNSPGLVTVEPVTLTRPATAHFPDLLAWFRKVADGAYELSRRLGGAHGIGHPSEGFYEFDIDVVEKDRANGYIQWMRLHNSFPTSVTLIDGLDNNAEERVMEQIILQPEWIEQMDLSKGNNVNVKILVDTPIGDLAADSLSGSFDKAFDFSNVIK